ncbi:hypothetical protein V8E54_014780, partial [Elaphomyces granulatus]
MQQQQQPDQGPDIYEKTPEEGLNDPFFILHTSGSSSAKGFPTVRFRDPRMRLDSRKISADKSLRHTLFARVT